MVPEDGSGAPPLPLDAWEDTKETLHRYAQVAGKIRAGQRPVQEPLVARHALRGRPRPDHGAHAVRPDELRDLHEPHGQPPRSPNGHGGSFGFALDDLAVADFYRKLVDGLADLGAEVSTDPRPFDLDDEDLLDKKRAFATGPLRPGVR